jgi:phage terminase large subunit
VQLILTKPQEDFVFSKKRFPAIIGGLGSGKTKAGTARLVLLMLSDRGTNAAYYMPTYDLLRLRAFTGLEDELRALGVAYESNRSEYSIRVIGYGLIILRSYDNPERIVAYEVAHSIVDELDTLQKAKAELVWRKITERNRQKCIHPQGNTVGCVTTPDQGYSGFIYKRWFKNATVNTEVIKAPTASNPFLPEGYIDQIRENYDATLAELYLNGEIVSLTQNKVYHFFDRDVHHIDRVLDDEDMEIMIGVDFNIGGCCAIVSVVEDRNPITVDEFISHDTRDFCIKLSKYIREGRKITVYPDASGQSQRTNASRSDIDIIRDSGFYVDSPRANPPIRDRVNAVNGLLSHNKWLINTSNCPNLTEALEAQGYDGRGVPEKYNEHPAIDDWVDAAGYFINRRWSLSKPIFETDIGMSI